MKIVAIDWLMVTPHPAFDVTWCSFLGHACKQVPLIRFFGTFKSRYLITFVIDARIDAVGAEVHCQPSPHLPILLRRLSGRSLALR